MRVCPACASTNEWKPEALLAGGQCGRCRQQIPPLDEPRPSSTHDVEQLTRKTRAPLLLVFTQKECESSRILERKLEPVAERMAGRALVLLVDVAQNPALAAHYRVRVTPSVAIAKGAQVLHIHEGPLDPADAMHLLKASLKVV